MRCSCAARRLAAANLLHHGVDAVPVLHLQLRGAAARVRGARHDKGLNRRRTSEGVCVPWIRLPSNKKRTWSRARLFLVQ